MLSVLSRFTKTRPGRGELLFAALILLQLAPVWAFRFIPTQDGMNHLDTANVLRVYHRPGNELVQKHYVITGALDPYWTVNLLLMKLLDIFPPLTAEKVLVSLYLVLFPLSVRFLVRSIDRGKGWISWLAFPFSMGLWFHLGFYNYCFGLALYCFVLGLWLRMGARAAPLRLAAIGVLAVVLYFTHPVPIILLMGSVAALAAWFTAFDFLESRRGRLTAAEALHNARTRCLGTALALLPAVFLTVRFTISILSDPVRPIRAPDPAAWAWDLLYGFNYLVSFPGAETVLMRTVFVMFVFLLAGAAVLRLASRGLSRNDGFLILFAALVFIYFRLTPWELMNKRILLFVVIGAILWLATAPFGPRVERMVKAAAFVLSACLALNLFPQYRIWNRHLAEASSLSAHIRPGHTLLYLCYARNWPDPKDTVRFEPLRHLGNYVALERNCVSFNNYEANERFLPLKYRPEVNPYRNMGYPEEARPLNLLGYFKLGGTIDYILVWVAMPGNIPKRTAEIMAPQLTKKFELIATAEGERAFLYRRVDLT